MFEKLDIGLKASIKRFMRKFGINGENMDESRIFEDFANYIVISNVISKDYLYFNKISTGNSRGIDGIGIIVNGKVFTELSDLETLGNNEKIKTEIVFIQSTLGASFDINKFSSFVDSVISFLVGDFIIEPFSEILEELYKSNKYIDNIEETPKVSLYYISGKTSHKIDKGYLEEQRSKIINREDIRYIYDLKDIYFWQKDEIKEAFRKIPTFHEIQIEIQEHVQLSSKDNVEIGLLAAIDFNELKKIILNSEGYIKEELFVENPRFYLDDTDVNKKIKETLENPDLRQYFIYLNNGLTIICDSIERHPIRRNVYTLTHPRIINGCQTTYILYEKYKENPQALEGVEVMAKIIATRDKELKEHIIFASNNQNAIDKDLLALYEFHRDIEEYFTAKEEILLNSTGDRVKLYYERLRGQYSSIEPYYSKINIEDMAKIYISVFLNEPHKMKSKSITVIKKYIEQKKIFFEKDNPAKYYYCGLLHFWLHRFISNGKINLETKTMDMHLLLVVNLLLEVYKNLKSIDDKIEFLNQESNALQIFTEAHKYINSQEYLFGRKGFYSTRKTKRLINTIKVGAAS